MTALAELLAYPLIIGFAVIACVVVLFAVLPAPIVPDDESEVFGDASTYGRETDNG